MRIEIEFPDAKRYLGARSTSVYDSEYCCGCYIKIKFHSYIQEKVYFQTIR